VPGSLVGVTATFDERLPMTSPGALAGRFGLRNRRDRILLIPRVLAVVRAPTLDADLAAGVRSSATLAHQLRADHLTRARVRRRIATALYRAVADASRPVRHGTPQAPLSREAIRCCHRELRALATSVATLENPRTQGLAIASQLAFDGRGPLFFQPGQRGAIERLANTIQAAEAALRVSAEFERVVHRPSVPPD
jgi:hypothetical protein